MGASVDTQRGSESAQMLSCNFQGHRQAPGASASLAPHTIQQSTLPNSNKQEHRIDHHQVPQAQDGEACDYFTKDIDLELAIRTIDPDYQMHQPNDRIYQARMSLLELQQDDPDYVMLVKKQRNLFREAKNRVAGRVG